MSNSSMPEANASGVPGVAGRPLAFRGGVFLLRHGQSTFNASFETTGVDPGHADARLSKLGRRQVAAVAPRVQALNVDLVVTSPTSRTIETMMGLFADAPVPPVLLDPSLRDRFMGDSCDFGRLPAELSAEFPTLDFSGIPDHWWTACSDAYKDGLEPYEMFVDRVYEFASRLAQRLEPRILVVGHEGTFRILTGIRMANAELGEWSRPVHA